MNTEERREYARKYYQDHREEKLAYQQARRKKHPNYQIVWYAKRQREHAEALARLAEAEAKLSQIMNALNINNQGAK